jgi:hypothetical protein
MTVLRRVAEVAACRHPPSSEWFWSELALLRERWNVLAHPFCVRWSAGEATRSDLEAYAREHDHLIVALAVASRNAAAKASGLLGEALGAHAAEEEAQVELWRAYARGIGLRPDGALDDAQRTTVECARRWVGDPSRSLAIDLVTLHAVESPRPELDGEPATAYFRGQAQLDKVRAALAQAALQGLLAAADPFALLAHVQAVHRDYWAVLDALEDGTGA